MRSSKDASLPRPITGRAVPNPAPAAHVLLVDDDPLQIKCQRLHLEKAGYHVTAAASAAEALQAVRRTIPDLVLSDVMMPGTDGFQLCRMLRRIPATESVPIILISGHCKEAFDVRHAAHCGANMFVSRSGGPAALMKALTRARAHPDARLDPDNDTALDLEYDGRVSTQLKIVQQQCRTILEGISDGVFLTDGNFIIHDANPAACEIVGATLDTVRGNHVMQYIHPQHADRLAQGIQGYIESGRYDSEFPFLRKDGTVRLGHFSGRRVQPNLYVNIFRDITEQNRKEEQLRLLAYTDPLTGLANRTTFQQRLEQATVDATAGGYAAGVLMLSLGNFREINDTLGPTGGDRVLCETAARLKGAAAGTEILCARLGASQYAVLLPRLDGEQHLVRAAHALLNVLATPITADGIPVEVAPCLGAAQCPGDALTGSDLQRRASVALNYAREHHLPYVNYSPEMDPFSLQRLTLVSDLRHAITHNEMELWYQPKFNLHSGRVDSVEALVRWWHPERSLVSPDEFIPAAERTGLIHLITRWVLNEALRQARRWQDQGLCLNISINISLSDLRQPSFQTQVLRAIQANGLPASSVTLEITESAAMQDPKRVTQVLGELRQQGLRISLDDFGTGQASLAHLHRLPVDEIKLDKSFVLNLADGRSQSIARATAMLAREFGLKSVAEGVEDANSLRLLGQLGFDRVQGYHVSAALPAAELEAWLGRPGVTQAERSSPRAESVAGPTPVAIAAAL